MAEVRPRMPSRHPSDDSSALLRSSADSLRHGRLALALVFPAAHRWPVRAGRRIRGKQWVERGGLVVAWKARNAPAVALKPRKSRVFGRLVQRASRFVFILRPDMHVGNGRDPNRAAGGLKAARIV